MTKLIWMTCSTIAALSTSGIKGFVQIKKKMPFVSELKMMDDVERKQLRLSDVKASLQMRLKDRRKSMEWNR